jgi:hypothetical protein
VLISAGVFAAISVAKRGVAPTLTLPVDEPVEQEA